MIKPYGFMGGHSTVKGTNPILSAKEKPLFTVVIVFPQNTENQYLLFCAPRRSMLFLF